MQGVNAEEGGLDRTCRNTQASRVLVEECNLDSEFFIFDLFLASTVGFEGWMLFVVLLPSELSYWFC